MPYSALDLVNAFSVKEFNFIGEKEKSVGLIAQDLRDALPEEYISEFIYGKETLSEYLGVYEAKLIYLALAAIKEQNEEITKLKAEIDELKSK